MERLVLYAGQPQGDPIVSYGPSIGDSKQDIVRLYTEWHRYDFTTVVELGFLIVVLILIVIQASFLGIGGWRARRVSGLMDSLGRRPPAKSC